MAVTSAYFLVLAHRNKDDEGGLEYLAYGLPIGLASLAAATVGVVLWSPSNGTDGQTRHTQTVLAPRGAAVRFVF
jgi:hypothetical protein